MHVPQSVEAATELREIAAVPKQMITPRLSKPLITVVQDTLVGVNRLTRPTEFFSRREYMNLLIHSKRWDGRIPPPAKTDPVPLWSGQQVVSALLPAVYINMGNKMWDDKKGKGDQNYVIINNGEIRQGILDGDIFDKALIHILYNDFSPEMTVDFIDSLQAVVAAYLQNAGFSVGVSDLIADSETLSTIAESSSEVKKKLESMQLQVHMGLFDNTSGRTNQEEFEARVFQTLDKARDDAGKAGLRSLAANNRMVNMVKCGSKGSDTNIAQMIALLGQQAIEGKRIAYGFQDRTLPHFKRYDDGADARGFIESSFVKGLNPAEFFFHAMTGREGLIDTAVKTADSGYMQRQLIKTMEDLITYHDGTVRDAGGLVVQFRYGDDGTSATKIENQPIGLGKMADSEIREKFSVPDVAAARSQFHIARVMSDRDLLVQNVWGGRVDRGVQSAVHLPRMIADAIQQLGLAPGKGEPVNGGHVVDTQDRIIQRANPTNRLWGALIRYHLNPRDMQSLGFTRAAFDWLAEQIVVKHMKSWVAPGEMAGIIAAQSLGEPTTQMSSHKETWISAKNLKNTSEKFVGQVGVFIDKLMTENSAAILSHESSEVLNLSPNTWSIMGVSNNEKTSWKPISQVSRHPANGGLVKVTTKSGRTTTATLSHSFLRRTVAGLEEIKGSELRVGHRIPVAYRMPASPDALTEFNGYTLNKEFGWLVGIYLADGSFSGNTVKVSKIHPIVEERIRALASTYGWDVTVRNYTGQFGPSKDTNIHNAALKTTLMTLGNTGSFDKALSAEVFHANSDFIAGVLSGYFDGDGNVNASRQQIRVGSRSKTLIRDMARLLAVTGVFATIKEETSVRIPDAVMYTLNIIRKHAAQFQKAVGFCLPEKASALAEIVAYNEREGVHSLREDLDLIPELGDVIAETGRLLCMPGQSRIYGRYGSDRVKPKTAVGRRTLEAYISEFREMMAVRVDTTVREKVELNLAILNSAVNSDVVWDEITELEILADPHELVYDFTVPGNDSFLVDDNIFVHNTLNSVDWHTEIVIARDGQLWTPKIGEFIDNYIANCDRSRIQTLKDDQIYVSLEGDGHEWSALSPDEDGKMVWTRLEAITRHPVVNADGSNTILEVTLQSGRKVRATKAHSFLCASDDNKLVPTTGEALRVGDLIPVVNDFKIAELPTISSLEMRSVLPPTEWIYGTEVQKALAVLTAADADGNRHWFSAANGTDFTVPYSRSDTFRDAYTKGKNAHASSVAAGFIYPKKMGATISQIPDTIPLTQEFGFFCGAYIAEGSTSPTQIQITNNDDAYLAPIRTLMDSWSVGHHTVAADKVIEKTGISGHTQSLVIHSTLLTAAMKAMFGRISYEKTFPDWVFQAPDEFVKGFVDGYVSGDGYVATDNTMRLSSVSEALMTRFSALLARYGIFTTHSQRMPEKKHFDSVAMTYTLYIPQRYAYVFGQHFGLTSTFKQERLGALVATGREPRFARDTLVDVVLDAVASIVEVAPTGDRVYDLTVEGTRNFTALNRIAVRDTFHLSGVAAKSGMTRGVPRLKELLKATQNPRATSLTIYMRRDLRTSKEAARRLAQELEFTMLKDLVTVSRIYYDPRDSASLISEDNNWLPFFSMFEQDSLAAAAEGEDGEAAEPPPQSPWILRLELNRERMFNKNITMEDITFVLRQAGMPVSVSYTDHNASRMVFRIRLLAEGFGNKNSLDDLTAIKRVQSQILTQTLVRGLPGLRAVSFRKVIGEAYERDFNNDGRYEGVDEFVLDTFGTNFLDVMIHPDVDGTRLLSNHVHDIYENLGIEAARQVLFREIFGLFEQAAPVNYRHVSILCDTMCNRGRMMSADRIGVNKKTKTGPLAKASFEQTQDIMLKAALFGEMDPVTGVSANIMTGQPIRGGTSFTQVLLDEAAMAEFMSTAPPPKRTIERAPQLAQAEVDRLLEAPDQPGCRQQDIRIPAALPPADLAAMGMPGGELPELEITLVDE